MNDITTTVVKTAAKVWDTLVTAEKAVEKAVEVAKPVVYEASDAAKLVGRTWSTPPRVVTPGVAAGAGGLLATVGKVAILGQMAVDFVRQGVPLVYKAGQLVTGSQPLTKDNLIRIAVGEPLSKEPIPEFLLPNERPQQAPLKWTPNLGPVA